MTLVAALCTFMVAFLMGWGGAGVTALILTLLGPAVLVSSAFLRRAPVALTLLLAAAAAVFQVTLAVEWAFPTYWDDAGTTPSTAFGSVFLVIGATPALVGLGGLWPALAGGAEPAERRLRAMLALVVLAFGSFLFWLFGSIVYEEATTGREDDPLFFSLPVLLYCAAAAIASAAAARAARRKTKPGILGRTRDRSLGAGGARGRSREAD